MLACFFKAGTTDILFLRYVCVWADGAPPQDYLEGERLRFSGGCYVGESFSKNHKYGAVTVCAAKYQHSVEHLVLQSV